MKIDHVHEGQARVTLTKDDVLLFNNALNEVINGLEFQEFQIRTGASLEQAKALLEQVGALYDQLS